MALYELLREQILEGAFDPEIPISQIKLAESLGVSRTPLREALRMLQRDGLIDSEPNRRVRVTALSIPDLEELYASRIVIESLALRITLPRATEADLDELEAALAAMGEAAANRDVARGRFPTGSSTASCAATPVTGSTGWRGSSPLTASGTGACTSASRSRGRRRRPSTSRSSRRVAQVTTASPPSGLRGTSHGRR